MPVDELTLNPPIQYSIIWLIIGLSLIGLILLWFGFAFWITRKRKANTLENLGPGAYQFDLDQLKLKYLKLIDECYQSYQQKHTSLRGLHRGLSMTVRYFVYEAKHFPAPRLTLSDLKRAPYPELTNVIGNYYDKEFALIEHGSPEESAEAAREMIRRWV